MRPEGARKGFRDLPISLRILCAFLPISFMLTAVSGWLYYTHAERVLNESVRNQATFICERAEHDFIVRYANPIAHDLRLMVTSPQFNSYLMCSKEEALVQRVEVEKWFLNLSRDDQDCLSTTFLNAVGEEKIAVHGNKRRRTFRSLEEIAEDGPFGLYVKRLFLNLQQNESHMLTHTGVFRDADGELGVLVGIAIQEPEAGGFGGALIQHASVAGYLDDVCRHRVLETPVIWVYGDSWDVLASPAQADARQNPRPFLAGEKRSEAQGIYTAQCKLLDSEIPIMTVACYLPPEVVQRRLQPVIGSVVLFFSGLLALTVICLLLICCWISKPIKKLTKAVAEFNAEEPDVILDDRLTESGDEIGILARMFKRMVHNLRESTTSIDNLNREVTERKKAEQKLANLVSLHGATLEATADGILVVDSAGHVVSRNRKFLELWRIPDSIAASRDDDRLLACVLDQLVDPEGFLNKAQQLYSRPEEHSHDQLNLKDGRVFERLSQPHEVDGDIRGRVWSFRDITQRMQATERQTELLGQLERKNQELGDFAYIVSHDLKAPLRGIKTLTSWIAADSADKLTDEGKEQLSLLLSRVDRMHDLIQGILQYSRIGRIQEEPVQVNLNELMPDIVDMLAPSENITITIQDGLPVILCEPTMMRQVLQNLLSNAIKYMDKPEGRISVCCVEEDEFWQFSVADNGPGIERKYFERVFQMFQTLSARDTFESTGVGLTVVKKIVETHGGAIWVESEVGMGSTFFFTLPKTRERNSDEKLPTCTAC